MKKGLLLCFCFCGLATAAQVSTEEILQKKRERQEVNKAMDLLLRQNPSLFKANKKAPKSTLQFGAPGVYILPQDGMPCMVPDTKEIAVIPNAFHPAHAAVAAIIPNASGWSPLPKPKIPVK